MVDAVLLDVNETLFSLDAVGEALSALDLGDVLPLWFARILRDGFAVTAMGELASFPDLARHHARELGRARGVVLDDGSVETVVEAFDEVEAHPDVDRGLRRLAAEGIRLATFTNGSAPIVARFLARSGLADVVEECVDVTSAGIWKPAPGSYAFICDHLGVAPSDAAMLAVHPWDVAGAMKAGMIGAWVNRDHTTWPAWLPSADVSAGSMVELADALVSR